MKHAFLAIMALIVSVPAYAVVPDPVSDTWYIAAGDSRQCIAVPVDVVGSTRNEWAAKGASIVDRNLDSGGSSVTIFQGGDKMLLIYEKESDCRIWLPVAIRMAQEQHAQ